MIFNILKYSGRENHKDNYGHLEKYGLYIDLAASLIFFGN